MAHGDRHSEAHVSTPDRSLTHNADGSLKPPYQACSTCGDPTRATDAIGRPVCWPCVYPHINDDPIGVRVTRRPARPTVAELTDEIVRRRAGVLRSLA